MGSIGSKFAHTLITSPERLSFAWKQDLRLPRQSVEVRVVRDRGRRKNGRSGGHRLGKRPRNMKTFTFDLKSFSTHLISNEVNFH